MSKLSEQLAELMEEDGFNQTTLAEAMNTSRPKISLYLTDKSNPNYSVFVSLIEFFNCSADFLVGKTDYPNRDKKYNAVLPFGEQLRKILNSRGISQYAFKKETGISWSVIHNWLNGKSQPSVDNITKVARYFGCSIDFILGREN